MYMPGRSDCKSMHWDSTSPLGINAVKHTWANYNLVHEAPYICKCGVEFDSHEELMEHTAKLNPALQLEDLGRAGVGIEREAHTNTLDLLRRARAILSFSPSCPNTQQLLKDIDEGCPIFVEEDNNE